MNRVFIIGCGFFGAVLAERLASVRKIPVTIFERRSVPGGNSASHIDPETGIECQDYGSHIFHTSDEKVWDYIGGFTSFNAYRHHVLTTSGGEVFSMPISLKTLCELHHRAVTPEEACAMFRGRNGASARNFEEKAVALAGETLYRKLLYGYTRKQWNREPSELPASILMRLPVRMNFNTEYFDDPHQGIPLEGYGALFSNLLKNPLIEVRYDTDFESVRGSLDPDDPVVCTGRIDEFFHCELGELEWRSLRFEWETLPVPDHQGTSVMNYADPEIPYTRIHEFKHFHPEWKKAYGSPRTVICREYPEDRGRGVVCYPVNTARNEELFQAYQALAARRGNVIFGGRLGCYRYWNMDQVIAQALACFEKHFS